MAKLAAGEPTSETEVTGITYMSSRADRCAKRTPLPNPNYAIDDSSGGGQGAAVFR
jgi:hypothetical protein